MLRWFKGVELLPYLAGCCFGGYRGANEIQIALSETAPTEFGAAEFAKQHRDQQWVRVVGRVAVEHRHVRASTFGPHRGKNLVYVVTPVVAEDWQPGQPVDVLATFGPIRAGQVESWLRDVEKTKSVQGQLRPGRGRESEEMFPKLVINPSFVTINEGTRPKHAFSMAGFLALMVLSGGLFVKRLGSLVRGERD